MISEELINRISDFIEMEHRSCSMDLITPEYVARSMQINYEDAVEVLDILLK